MNTQTEKINKSKQASKKYTTGNKNRGTYKPNNRGIKTQRVKTGAHIK